ncbi:MAG: binding-protein-dependent transport system inner rane component [Sporomusa sp.]|nr:binding-protein-dependent transport system inner rane component [Sporomusa sp.]
MLSTASLAFLFQARAITLGGENMRLLAAASGVALKSSGLLIFMILWEIAPRLGWADAQFLPPLSAVAAAGYKLWDQGLLYSQLIVSLWRAALGLLLALLIAVPTGAVLAGWFPRVLNYLDPLFRLLSNVNPFSLAPVFMLFFGIGETMKLMIIALVALWPILFHTITGICTVDPLLIKTGRSMNVSALVLMRDILLPGAFPTIVTGIRIGVQMAVFMLVAAEMLGAKAGLGWLVHASAMLSQLPRMYAGGVFIILLGVLINKVILHIEKTSFYWKQTVEIFDTAAPAKVKGRWSRVFNQYYVPAVVILFAVIIAAGGHEINRLNTERLLQHTSPQLNHATHTMGVKQHPPGCTEKKDEPLNYTIGE